MGVVDSKIPTPNLQMYCRRRRPAWNLLGQTTLSHLHDNPQFSVCIDHAVVLLVPLTFSHLPTVPTHWGNKRLWICCWHLPSKAETSKGSLISSSLCNAFALPFWIVSASLSSDNCLTIRLLSQVMLSQVETTPQSSVLDTQNFCNSDGGVLHCI